MTRYEKGFFEKCAERGLGAAESVRLMKSAKPIGQQYAELANGVDRQNLASILTGGIGGAVLGGVQEEEDRKKQLRNIILGAVLGSGGAYLGTRSSKPLLKHIGDVYRTLDSHGFRKVDV